MIHVVHTLSDCRKQSPRTGFGNPTLLWFTNRTDASMHTCVCVTEETYTVTGHRGFAPTELSRYLRAVVLSGASTGLTTTPAAVDGFALWVSTALIGTLYL